jgi:FkbH-like protein
MKLREAIQVKRMAATRSGRPFVVHLATGAMPLHLETLLVAALATALPHRAIVSHTGTYGDLLASLEAAQAAGAENVAALIEYRDLDARFGFRRAGSWASSSLNEALEEAERRLVRLRHALSGLAAARVAVVLPTLPLPPISSPPRNQSSQAELRLGRLIAAFGEDLDGQANVTIVSRSEIDRLSPPAARHDIRSEILADFPYAMEHAEHLADLLCRVLAPPEPLKGLITDLDDTLWRGIVGEVGPENVSWSLEHGSHVHAIYQQLLESAAEQGVLLGVASKNDPGVAAQALARRDLRPSGEAFFPIEVGWHAKSEAVDRILKIWNISADAVAFIDDSPMEIAEVEARHPEMHCYLFPRDEAGVVRLMGELRDRFGKASVSDEDRLRARSIRANAATVEALAVESDPDSFLTTLDAELQLNFAKTPLDPRALELVNKTNQFNLNGRRVDEAAWRSFLARKDSFLLVTSYEDKFGPLGKIGVAFGRQTEEGLFVDGWVLSCRAFSRRVEHAMLDAIFEHFGADHIALSFEQTKRNGPTQSFVSEIGATTGSLSRVDFKVACPPLPHHRVLKSGADSAVAP